VAPGVTPPLPIYVMVDVLAVSAASVVAHGMRFGLSLGAALPGPDIPYVLIALASVPTWLAVLALAGCYDRRVLGLGSEEYRRVLNGGVHFLAMVAILHFVFRLVFARGWVGVMIPVAVVLNVVMRYWLRRWLYQQRGQGRYVHRLLLVGSPATVVDVGEHLARERWTGFRVVGVCTDLNGHGGHRGNGDDADGSRLGVAEIGGRDNGGGVNGNGATGGDAPANGEGDGDGVDGAARGAPSPPVLVIAGERVPVVGSTADITRAIVLSGADSVAVTDESASGDLRELAGAAAVPGVELLVAPAITDVAGPRTVVRPVAGLPLLHVPEPTFAGPQRVLKEAMDRLAAAVGLLALAPVFLAIAAAIRIDTPGPTFFRQARVGRDGRRFNIVKFRTMVQGAEALQPALRDQNEADGVLFKLRRDPRVTRVGRLLRRWSIDELPQLWNVLKGEMSLVGPRPPVPGEVELYESHVTRRLLVKPGMTGLWQVSGRADLHWDEAVRLDLYYVDHWSPVMDAAIILRTFTAVARGEGAY
jgi:lipopolysaccharide/colanic/teichoic acid biosynthesis glycosyltransferase